MKKSALSLTLLISLAITQGAEAQSVGSIQSSAIGQTVAPMSGLTSEITRAEAAESAVAATANAAIPQAALGVSVAPLSGGVVPPSNLPAATSSTPGAMSLSIAAAQAPVQSVGGQTGVVTGSQVAASAAPTLAGTGLTNSGGTLSVQYGTTGATAAAGNDSRIVGALQTSGGAMTGALSMGTNLLVGSNFSVTGGDINGTPVGSTTPSTGVFTTISLTAEQTAKYTLMAPNGNAGAPTWRQIVPTDISGASTTPTINDLQIYSGFSGTYPQIAIPSTSRIYYNMAAPASNDYGVSFVRNSSSSTIASGLSHVTDTNCNIGSGDTENVWCNEDIVTGGGSSNTGTGVTRYMQFLRTTPGTEAGWGFISDVEDSTDLPSSTSGGALLAGEIDFGSNGVDDRNNGASYFGAGVRRWLQFNFNRKTATDNTPNEMSYGLWMTDALDAGGQDPHSYVDSLIGFQNNFQVRTGLDMRGAIAPTGSGNPVVSVAMIPGQVIDFNAPSSLTAPPGATMTYYDGNIVASVPLKGSAVALTRVTVSALPACSSSTEGDEEMATDLVSPTYNATLTGGGSVERPVWCTNYSGTYAWRS